jgi:hypothetical protein
VTRKHLAVIAVLAMLVVGASAGAALSSSGGGLLPGTMIGNAPWGANNGRYLKQRLQDIGLHALAAEGTKLHTHSHLYVVVNGKIYPVPALIGINVRQRFISELHTHDVTGIIHVESPTVRTFTLGEFFDVWGLRFSSRCLGAYCASGKKQVMVWVHGKRVMTDPRKIVLAPHLSIVVAYGTLASLKPLGPIPATYPFPKGY